MDNKFVACLFFGELFSYDEKSPNYNIFKTFKDFASEFFFSNYEDGLDVVLQDEISECGRKYIAIKDSIRYVNYDHALVLEPRNFYLELEWIDNIYYFCKKNGLYCYNPTWHLILVAK